MVISNIDDKRQITGTYCVSLKGEFLPPHLIYQGETPACHPKHVKFPDGFHVKQTENHWSNEIVHLAYLKKTIIPYIEKVRKLNLKKDRKALLMYHVFKGQTTGAVSELLEKNNIILKKVPANKTDLFQPLDLSFNKSFKCSLPDNTKPGTLSSICTTRLGSRASWCQSRPTAFGCNVTTCKMGSRILSPYAAQRWKENRRERVSKRPRQGSIWSGHSPSELHRESILKSRHWSFVVQLMLETGPNLLSQMVLPTGVGWWVWSRYEFL